VAFIKQEALEKAREIKVKADEEFAIEKVRDARGTLARDAHTPGLQAKLVKQEQQAIDAQYEKKTKGALTAQKMCVLSPFPPPARADPCPPSPPLPDAVRIGPCSAQSTFTNKSRLKLLHRREEHLQDLFETARKSLLDLATVRPSAAPTFFVIPLSRTSRAARPARQNRRADPTRVP
jgi:V-type H+-transporting ATPase subunit E